MMNLKQVAIYIFAQSVVCQLSPGQLERQRIDQEFNALLAGARQPQGPSPGQLEQQRIDRETESLLARQPQGPQGPSLGQLQQQRGDKEFNDMIAGARPSKLQGPSPGQLDQQRHDKQMDGIATVAKQAQPRGPSPGQVAQQKHDANINLQTGLDNRRSTANAQKTPTQKSASQISGARGVAPSYQRTSRAQSIPKQARAPQQARAKPAGGS
ncbi:hypothetical protein MP228_011808 [Amoeboaphelidium protococcarum]|nr:hypothetical protein MP228_011808 [Amoeboaphelidium protococcarum]